MPLLNSKQRTASWTISGMAAVIAGVIAFQTWAQDNFVTQAEQELMTAEYRVLHDKQYLSRQLDHLEVKLDLSEMKADRLRDLTDLSPREVRELERLEDDIEYYTEELRAIRDKLRIAK